MRHPITALSVFALTLALAPLAAAQETVCVPGNPLYDRGDYRCFQRRPVPSRARAVVRAHVEAARFLSGAPLPEHLRAALEDHFDGLEHALAANLPSLVDGDGGLHTPDVRLSVVILPSGAIGRVRVLTRHGHALDRAIAQSLMVGVSNEEAPSLEQSEVEAIVRLRPQLAYTRYRSRGVPGCCVDGEGYDD